MINRYQGGVLADRYLETILADWKNTLLLLAQAPLLALMAVAVWKNVDQDTNSLYFVMTLSAFWVGCMNACREIVKERALFLRERAVNLEVTAYLYSKLRVLVLLNGVQMVCYGLIINNYLTLKIPVGWLLIDLFITAGCGTALGLLISSAVKRSDYAVGLVPLVILPQILFSEFAIAKDSFEGFSKTIYAIMPSRWGYESMIGFADINGDQLDSAAKLLPLLALSAVFIALSIPVLARQRY